jgi:hypothetical protein
MEVRYQLRYSPENRIYVPPETRDSIPAASTLRTSPSGPDGTRATSHRPFLACAAGPNSSAAF